MGMLQIIIDTIIDNSLRMMVVGVRKRRMDIVRVM